MITGFKGKVSRDLRTLFFLLKILYLGPLGQAKTKLFVFAKIFDDFYFLKQLPYVNKIKYFIPPHCSFKVSESIKIYCPCQRSHCGVRVVNDRASSVHVVNDCANTPHKYQDDTKFSQRSHFLTMWMRKFTNIHEIEKTLQLFMRNQGSF